GPDAFSYRAFDGVFPSNTITVVINVLPVNDPPTAVGDNFGVNFGVARTVTAPGVLANDFDVDGAPPTTAATLSIPPATAGVLNFGSNGAFTFTPSTGFSG